jgi:phosphoribosylanthranilate isomerase
MSVFVKICGVTDEAALDAAVAAGADAIGFVFHLPSLRHLAPRRAAELAARLPGGVLAVAVTRHPEPDLVHRVLEAFRPDAWQTDAVDFDRIRLPPTIECWPVLRDGATAEQAPRGRFVFDAPESGQGRRADWHAAAMLARRSKLILGGGLDATNVAAAIAAVRPFGVDVSSGVESAPGVKDPMRIQAFVAAARASIAA